MEQIVVVSGKGGTGKTSLTSALATVAQNAVFADCDVDAANLYLTLKPEDYKEEIFPGSKTAIINDNACVSCGLCEMYCRFDAIHAIDGKYDINPFSCEGCGLCTHVCPHQAITMEQNMDSRWFMGTTRFGKMVHARLGVAEDLSGKLVTLVRNEVKKIAINEDKDYVIIDGPPGIGCPVIASVTGVDKVLVITEPSKSGMHDMKRVVELAQNFKLPVYVVINKVDINPVIAEEIKAFCLQKDIQVIGELPFDSTFVDAMVNQKTILEYAPNSIVSNQIKSIWHRLIK